MSPILSEVVSASIDGLHLSVELPRTSRTARNLVRAGDCVVNLPDDKTVAAIDSLARKVNSIDTDAAGSTTRIVVGGPYERAHMTLVPAEAVSSLRALECPVQLEEKLQSKIQKASSEQVLSFDRFQAFELDILRVHLDPAVVNHDERWKPLMDSLRAAYRTTPSSN